MSFSKKGGLKTTFHCLLCKALLPKNALKTLEGHMEDAIFHGACQSCGASQLFAIWQEDGGTNSVAMQIDCDFAEMKRFWEAEAIDANDVIMAHSGLKLDNFLKIK
jgi:hypothetical protein